MADGNGHRVIIDINESEAAYLLGILAIYNEANPDDKDNVTHLVWHILQGVSGSYYDEQGEFDSIFEQIINEEGN